MQKFSVKASGKKVRLRLDWLDSCFPMASKTVSNSFLYRSILLPFVLSKQGNEIDLQSEPTYLNIPYVYTFMAAAVPGHACTYTTCAMYSMQMKGFRLFATRAYSYDRMIHKRTQGTH